MIDERAAVRAFAAAVQAPADQCRARRLGGTDLWSVFRVDEQERPFVGTFTILGPDSRLWMFSSNPGIHDPDLVVSVMAALYSSELAAVVGDELLGRRLEELTAVRKAQTSAVVRAAETGELRPRTPRSLP